jgi:hypothetical protein
MQAASLKRKNPHPLASGGRLITHRMKIIMKTFPGVLWLVLPALFGGWAGPVRGTEPLDEWTVRSVLPVGTHLRSVTFGHNLFVAVEAFGTATSSDGITWATNKFSPGPLRAIAVGQGTFAVVGGDFLRPRLVAISTNGLQWAPQNSSIVGELSGIAYGNGAFVAVGSTPSFEGDCVSAVIGRSLDGMAWSEAGAIQEGSSPGQATNPMTFGSATITTRPGTISGTNLPAPIANNSVIWTNRMPPTCVPSPLLKGIAYGNGLFTAVSSDATVTSADGTTWFQHHNAGGLAVGFGNGTFVAVGPAGRILTSSDGVTWVLRRNTTNEYLNAITYGAGTFVAVGSYGAVLTSRDAVSWTARISGTKEALYGVTYGNGTFVAVGSNGTILRSGTVISLSGQNRFGEGGFELTVAGETGRGYRLQAASDLAGANWTDLVTLTNVADTTTFLDPTATNFRQRFYRVVSP